MDLNVKSRLSDHTKRDMLRRLHSLGVTTVAWNHVHVGKVQSQNTQLKPASPVALSSSETSTAAFERLCVLNNVSVKPREMRQLSRLTVMVDEAMDAQSLTMQNEALSRFDIIAAVPSDAQVFTALCTTSDVDIISFDLTHKIPFTLNQKVVDAAVKRGIVFEATYSAVLSSNATHRRESISNASALVRVLRGRGLLLSSGADAVSQFRSPSDVRIVAELLGVSKHRSGRSNADAATAVLQHAAARKRLLFPVEVLSVAEFERQFPEINAKPSQSSLEEQELHELKLLAKKSNGSNKKKSQNGVEDEDEEEENGAEDDFRQTQKKTAISSDEVNDENNDDDDDDADHVDEDIQEDDDGNLFLGNNKRKKSQLPTASLKKSKQLTGKNNRNTNNDDDDDDIINNNDHGNDEDEDNFVSFGSLNNNDRINNINNHHQGNGSKRQLLSMASTLAGLKKISGSNSLYKSLRK